MYYGLVPSPRAGNEANILYTDSGIACKEAIVIWYTGRMVINSIGLI